MKLSKVLAVALLGTIGLTSQAMAAGTTAGTTISNAPSLSYEMSGVEKKAESEAVSYVVDRVINFEVTAVGEVERSLQVDGSELVAYKISNLGNSEEAVAYMGNYGSTKEFEFTEIKKYIDADGDGVLSEAEKVHTEMIPSLAADAEIMIWAEVTTPSTTIGQKTVWEPMCKMAPLGSTSSADAYATQSATNTVDAVDIVFADYNRNNTEGVNTTWTLTENLGLAKLTTALEVHEVMNDPVNGTTNPQAIPGALVVMKYSITNNTSIDAKDVVFTLNYDTSYERVATDDEVNPYWGGPAYFTWVPGKSGDQGVTVDDGAGTITYTIPLIKAGESFYPHLATVIK
ncbi:MAG: hypothetical protein K0U38_04125 [Epsilonproteobacteria bacterium]|nr:hypothetical protein [Campylobacterota bacterium]